MSDPVNKIRVGNCTATIWENKKTIDGKEVIFNSVSIDKNYKDKDDQWKTTNSLGKEDIPKMVLALTKAFEFVSIKAEEWEQEQ